MFKERLKAVRYSQTELMKAIKERYNESLDPAEFSKICSQVLDSPKAHRVREEAEIILIEWEQK